MCLISVTTPAKHDALMTAAYSLIYFWGWINSYFVKCIYVACTFRYCNISSGWRDIHLIHHGEWELATSVCQATHLTLMIGQHFPQKSLKRFYFSLKRCQKQFPSPYLSTFFCWIHLNASYFFYSCHANHVPIMSTHVWLKKSLGQYWNRIT